MTGEEMVARLRPVIADERVLAALGTVPRERFVRPSDLNRAYENVALPIECGQTISQPVVVARMLELLELHASDRVLDIGTGSGYHAALLSLLVDEVWTVERYPELSEAAAARLAELDCRNVTCVVADGSAGLPDQAPFDAINVAAATAGIPRALLEQLAPDGRLVAPVGSRRQRLTRVRRLPAGFLAETLEEVRFVPLVSGELPLPDERA